MDSATNNITTPSETTVQSDIVLSSSGNTVTSDGEANTSTNAKSQSPKPLKAKHAPVHYTDDDYFPSTRVKANRVRPEMDSSLSNDTILLDILNILYDNESGNELENGFTVKQICDKLLEKDPKMIDLSTKFANLISAKINAYAKKVENRVRGDFNVNIKYWIIRKWAKGNSPKRMVYIYKGLLPEGYYETPPPTPPTPPTGSSNGKHSGSMKKTESSSSQKKVMVQDNMKKEMMVENSTNPSYSNTINGNGLSKTSSTSGGSNKFSINLNRFQQFGYNMNNINTNISKNPSSAALQVKSKMKQQQKNPVTSINNKSTYDKNKTKPLISGVPRIGSTDDTDSNNNGNGNSAVKKVDSTNIAQQIQLIQRSIQQISPVQKITKSSHRHKEQQSLLINRKWMETLKSGFMSEEIMSPDNMKLSDFDTLFN